MASESIEARLDLLIALVDKHEQQLQRIIAQLENVAQPEITTSAIVRQDTRDLIGPWIATALSSATAPSSATSSNGEVSEHLQKVISCPQPPHGTLAL